MALRPPADQASAPSSRTAFQPLAWSRPSRDPDGAWWPRSRSLADELPAFFDAWPPERGRIQRLLYSSPDWDDHPHWVSVPGRRVKTGTFPRDDTHLLTVSMEDRTDHFITVIASSTSEDEARRVIDAVTAAPDAPDVPNGDAIPRWDGEGGSP